MSIDRFHSERGLSLIELIMFIIIVGVGVAGILGVLDYTVRNSADPMLSKQSLAIAESLLEEIQLKDFDATVASRNGVACFAGVASQANRPSFDCVFNYNGFPSDVPVGIRLVDGVTAVGGLEAYSAAVVIVPVGFTAVAGATSVWLITVTVTDPLGRIYTHTGYRFNYG